MAKRKESEAAKMERMALDTYNAALPLLNAIRNRENITVTIGGDVIPSSVINLFLRGMHRVEFAAMLGRFPDEADSKELRDEAKVELEVVAKL